MSQRTVGIVLACVIATVVVIGAANSPGKRDASVTSASDSDAFKPEQISQTYPGPWLHEFNTEITRTLVAADIKACGIYRYRVSRKSKTEFLVYCSRDNKHWQAYMVWPNIRKVLGPYPPDPQLP